MRSTDKPTLILAIEPEFPFDRTVGDIFDILGVRFRFCVPDWKIDFHETPDYRFLREIRGEDFLLRFGRKFGKPRTIEFLTSEIVVPKIHLHVGGCPGPITLFRYVGDNWEADKEWWFSDEPKGQARSRGEQRRYLVYRAGGADDATASPSFRQLSYLPALVADVEADFEPEVYEPQVILTVDYVLRVDRWLQRHAVGRLLQRLN